MSAHVDGSRLAVVIAGRPRPQPRPRVYRGRAISVADDNAKAWIRLVEAEFRAALAVAPVVGGPVAVSLTFLLAVKDARRWGQVHTATPDTDNLAKLVLDCAQRVGLVPADQAVVRLHVVKLYARQDGALFEMEPQAATHAAEVLGRAPSVEEIGALLSHGFRAI